MIFPLRVHFLAIYLESSHFPPKNEFSNQRHAVSPGKCTFFSQGVCSRQLQSEDEISTEYSSYECLMSPRQACFLSSNCKGIYAAFRTLSL